MQKIILKSLIILSFLYFMAYGIYNFFVPSAEVIPQSPTLIVKRLEPELNGGKSGSSVVDNTDIEQDPSVDSQEDRALVVADNNEQKIFPEIPVSTELDEYLTVQVFSFNTLEDALQGYEKVKKMLDEVERKDLRIEYVQHFYTVRVGKFKADASRESQSAHSVLVKLQALFKSSFLLSAYIIDERIQKKYKPDIHDSTSLSQEQEDHLEPIIIPEVVQAPDLEVNQKVVPEIVQEEKAENLIVGSSLPGKESDQFTDTAENPVVELKKKLVSEDTNLKDNVKNVKKPAAEKEIADEDAFVSEFLMVIDKDDIGQSISSPGTVFFDKKAAELYIVSQSVQRVVVLGSDYFPENSLGKGRNIESPNGGFVDNQGNVYICQDRFGNKPPRLTVLNSAFLPVREYLFNGIDGAEKFVPRRGAAGKDGRLYLAGAYSRKVMVLDKDGNFIKWLKVTDDISKGTSKLGQTMKEGPVLIKDVEIDSLGNVFLLSEETSKIYIFNSSDEFLFTMGKKGGNRGRMSRPNGLAIDEKNRCIYIVDYMRHTILAFDYSGQYRFSIGGRGGSDGWFNFPIDVGIGPRNNLIVADFFNHRVQVFEVTFKKELPTRPKKLWKIE